MSRDPARLRGEKTVLAIVSIALVATIAVPTNARLPWLIHNASGSAPLGFYGVENRTPSRCDMVVVRPSATPENLFANHGVLPRAMPLLKRVIAVGGAQICRPAGVAYVNGMVAAEALEGRPLPFWHGARGSSKAIFSSSNPIPMPSTAGIFDRSATAKLSVSRGHCGRGIHRNDTPVLSPARMVEF
jgi:type IV secretory pathway protease TraF